MKIIDVILAFLLFMPIWLSLMMGMDAMNENFTRIAVSQERMVEVQGRMVARQAAVDSILWGIKP